MHTKGSESQCVLKQRRATDDVIKATACLTVRNINWAVNLPRILGCPYQCASKHIPIVQVQVFKDDDKNVKRNRKKESIAYWKDRVLVQCGRWIPDLVQSHIDKKSIKSRIPGLN
jgi:hypothetical protein